MPGRRPDDAPDETDEPGSGASGGRGRDVDGSRVPDERDETAVAELVNNTGDDHDPSAPSG